MLKHLNYVNRNTHTQTIIHSVFSTLKLLKMKISKLLIALALFTFLNAQSQQKNLNPDDILVGNRKLPKILLVGTFHFAYYNRDVYKTSADKQLNILSAQKQKELNELANYIARFKPTKVVVEQEPGDTVFINRYRAIKAGTKERGKNEIEQLAFRLMDKCKLDTLYGADAGSIFQDLYYSKDSLILRPTLDTIFAGWENYSNTYKCNEPACKLFDSVQAVTTEFILKQNLLNVFYNLNSANALKRNYGSYFSGDYFKKGDTRGADALAMDWYDRNLRIYRNIQKITTSENDRILVLFGQGHISILNQIFDCDPNYKLIPFNGIK